MNTVSQKKGVYKREGRSPKWRRLCKPLEDLIEQRRARYCGSQNDALLASDGERAFFWCTPIIPNFRAPKNPKNLGSQNSDRAPKIPNSRRAEKTSCRFQERDYEDVFFSI